MADEQLSPVKLLRLYAERLDSLEKEVTALEKKAKSLSKKHREVTERRAEISEDIHERQQSIAALMSQREGLKQEYAEASFEADEQRISEIQARKSEIDDEVLDHQEALAKLQEQLDKNRIDEVTIAEAIVELEDLKPGDAFRFAGEMKTVLMRHEFEQQQRISQAQKLLSGKASAQAIESVRMEDEEYAERKARQQQERERINELARARGLKESKPAERYIRDIDERTGRVKGFRVLDRENREIAYKTREEVYQEA